MGIKKLRHWMVWKRTGNPKKDALSFIVYCAKGYLMAVAVIIILQRFFIYHPSTTWISQPEGLVKAVTYMAQDHISLTSWYCAPQRDKPVFVMFHGNAGNISFRALKQSFFCEQGYGFLLAEYRGYGGNAGSASEDGFYKDGRAAISWLVSDQKIDENRIIIYGESIGTGVAVQMAVEHPEAKALVLEAPLTSIPDLIGSIMPWMWPFRFLAMDIYDNLSKVSDVQMPTMVIHGDSDEVIPVEKGKMVYAASGATAKKLTLVKGGRHNDLANFDLLFQIQDFARSLRSLSQ